MLLPGGSLLCALHRGDSFLIPDPGIRKTRVMVYRWNGFGFSGVEAPDLFQQCRVLFDAQSGDNPRVEMLLGEPDQERIRPAPERASR